MLWWSRTGWFLILRYRSLNIYHFCMLVPLPGTNSHISLPENSFSLKIQEQRELLWKALLTVPGVVEALSALGAHCTFILLDLVPKGQGPNIFIRASMPGAYIGTKNSRLFFFENWYIWSCCGPSTVSSTLIICPERMKRGVLTNKKKLSTSPNRGSLMKNCQVFII